MPEMRVSLSPKEVSELHFALAMLPFPPLPVRVEVSNSISLEDEKDRHNAFAMATLELCADAKKDDGIINSHSVVAALLFYHRWEGCKQIERMERQKAAAVFALQHGVLRLMTPACSVPENETHVYDLFLGITQRHLNAMMPPDTNITLTPVKNFASLGHEHAAHIVLAHYCHGQGELYSNRKGMDKCLVHEAICKEYAERCRQARENPDSIAARAVDKDGVRNDIMEIAEIYSQNTLSKLLILCFVRLKNDVLYGCKDVSGFETAVAALRGCVEKLNAEIGDDGDEPKLELGFEDLQ